MNLQDNEQPIVLFVDDEEGVLAGLRTSLRRLRHMYRFRFALSAAEALDLMDAERVDVVVTDMRMPGATGVDLLRRVRAAHPEVVRFVLSGEAAQDLVMQAVPVTHRWLTKPCTHEQLATSLAEAVQHRALLTDPEIDAALGGASALPSPPSVYLELVAAVEDRNVSLATVAEVIETDAAVSAKLLQWANSAFSGGSPVPDVRGAVVRLGLTTVSQLVLCADAVKLLDPAQPIPGLTGELVHRHANDVSEIAAQLAGEQAALGARIGGLLSHVGLLLEVGHLRERLVRAYEHAERTDVSLVDAEARLFGVCHPKLGGRLLSIWGLPTDLVLAVSGGHDRPGPELARPMGVVDAVRVARLVAQRRPGASGLGAPHRDRVDPALEGALARWAAPEPEEVPAQVVVGAGERLAAVAR